MEKERSLKGLTAEQVEASRQTHGSNVLTPRERTPWWRKFAEKFKDPLIIILMVAAILSIGIACYEFFGLQAGSTAFFEPVGILVAICLATGLAFWFEWQADREFSLLNQQNDQEPVRVIRDGREIQVLRSELVVGDLVRLSTGDEVPADGQLLEATQMLVDESSFTGEPVCTKSTLPEEQDTNATFPSDTVLRSAKILEGHGLMQVTAVGDATQCGHVFTEVQIDNSVRTPLNEQLDRLGRLISRFSYAIAALVVVGRIVMWFVANDAFNFQSFNLSIFNFHFLAYLLQSVMLAVTLIVVAVPEGLPMAVTLSLAYSMRRMLKTNNLVRKMHACETMGATTVICTDKTGTLTQNQMQVVEMKTFSSTLPCIFENIAVNSTASLDGDQVLGNPTEGALLLWLRNQGTDYRPLRSAAHITEEIPFTTERKYMATRVNDTLYIKGAPEIVMEMCGVEDKDELTSLLLQWQERGLRTLALAHSSASNPQSSVISHQSSVANPQSSVINHQSSVANPQSSVAHSSVINPQSSIISPQSSIISHQLDALVAIADPVREEVPAAVAECIRAGIDVKIVTGDTPATATEIARQIGLSQFGKGALILTGPEVAALSDEELRACAKDIVIIARARPMDKQRLVHALQACGEVVAVTGDGTNDAPALKAAHVGLSMGDGTAVAKEASDITILDNSFASIGRAVMWGRSLYRNIQRFILFQLTVNVCACLTVLAGAFMGTDAPLTVTQMLWVNLIMDTFAAMALASLPPTESVMHERPRDRRKFIISTPMWQFILSVGGLFFVLMTALLWYFERDGHINATDQSIFFTTFVMLQFWNIFNARAFLTHRSAFNLRGCKGFLTIISIIFFGQILIVQFGGEMFNATPLSWNHWLLIILATFPTLLIGEAIRWVKSLDLTSEK